jgi:predicted lipoprotein with Yx(FWY)xxD motif
MLCDNVNPFNPRHRCTLGLGHPIETAHTDGDAAWLYDAPKLAAWLQDRMPGDDRVDSK